MEGAGLQSRGCWPQRVAQYLRRETDLHFAISRVALTDICGFVAAEDHDRHCSVGRHAVERGVTEWVGVAAEH